MCAQNIFSNSNVITKVNFVCGNFNEIDFSNYYNQIRCIVYWIYYVERDYIDIYVLVVDEYNYQIYINIMTLRTFLKKLNDLLILSFLVRRYT